MKSRILLVMVLLITVLVGCNSKPSDNYLETINNKDEYLPSRNNITVEVTREVTRVIKVYPSSTLQSNLRLLVTILQNPNMNLINVHGQ